MSRPKGGYYIDGKRIPGTTTIISRFKDSGALIYWAWDQGRQGLDFRETRDKAANAGTCAHNMVECDIRGKDFDESRYPKEIIDKATAPFVAYLDWKKQTNLEPADTEMSLISEKHEFGGTLDSVFINGKLALGDWKTSNGVYPDYLIQLGAYAVLWNENFPGRKIEAGFHLIRFSKQSHPDDPVTFSHHYWDSLALAIEQFLLLRKAYDNDKRIKKML